MKRILITGSTGFLGKHFIQYLHKKYPNEFEIIESNTNKNNLLNYGGWDWEIDYTKTKKIDYIFHFAAYTKAGDWCLTHPGEQWLINQQINTNIIRFWKDHHPEALFIGIGTSCSYGNNDDNLWKGEEKYLNDLPEKSLLTYAYTKRMLYLGLDSVNKQYGLNYLYLVPSTLYGTQFTESDNHFIYDVIRKVYEAKYNENEVEMWGNGLQKRELTWVEDFIELMFYKIFKTEDRNRIINIASGQDNSIGNYYHKICELFDYDFTKIRMNQNKYTGMYSNKLYCSDPGIRYYKYKDLDEGLKELVKYYKSLKYD